jgi:hypothetical protein
VKDVLLNGGYKRSYDKRKGKPETSHHMEEYSCVSVK